MATILVIGDAFHDVFLTGTVERLSPEAPVPVLLNPEPDTRDGGAANVARHLEALGHSVTLMALCPWPTKTRYLDDSGHHLLRVDLEPGYRQQEQEAHWERIRQLPPFDAVVVSDYHKGSVGDPPYPAARIRTADAKREFWRFEDFTLVQANRHAIHGTQPILPNMVVTLGADGCNYGGKHYAGYPVACMADVTGAGDTFLAWMTDGVLRGLPIADILARANHAASRAVQRRGTVVIGDL